MPKLTLKEFKDYLYNQSQEELVLELEKIYNLYPNVQDYFQALLSGTEEQFLKVTIFIHKEFNRPIPKNPDLKKIKKAISDFNKLGPSPANLAKLYLQLAIGLMSFIKDYGAEDYYMPFYSAAKNFLLFVSKHNLQNEFGTDAQKIVEYEQDYGSDLTDIYHQNFTKPIRKN
jgi:hypothetical protein